MASSMEEQSLDLTTCCICLESYDLKERKPKYVPCTHTFCQVCLKVRIYYLLKKHILSFNRVFIILRRAWGRDLQKRVTYPVCKTKFQLPVAAVEGLPDNIYAIHIIKFDNANKAAPWVQH